jgi:23S rRNA pseudouridine1911/1915/1917 synthase
MHVKIVRHTVDESETAGIRLDKYISDKLLIITRSQLKARLAKVLVNGIQAKLSKKINPGDELEISITAPPHPDISAEDIKLDIIYEDKNVIVINKPQGMVVHPGSGINSGTLINALLFYVKELKANFNEEIRPGIVHRLDKDTSGVIITAKNPFAHEYLSTQFRKRKSKKVYLSIVKGQPQYSNYEIDTFISRDPKNRKRFKVSNNTGKRSVTEYEILRAYNNYTFLRMKPKTGRTHQLRVHACSMGCPILGDPIYSRSDARFPEITLMLHAFKLYIKLPGEDNTRLFRAPIPARFNNFFKLQQNK